MLAGNMKLLLIEDNLSLANSLKDYLAKDCLIEVTAEGKTGINLANSGRYDAVVLDLFLPDMPGEDVCLAIRKINSEVPIIILTASAEPNIKVKLFEAGADDYITKPFHVSELKARLVAILRRQRFDPEAPYLLKADDLILDPIKRQVKRGSKPISLRRKEFGILEYLLRNRGRVVTRAMIMDNVWDEGSDSWNNTIDVHIKYLRDKVDRPFKHKLIKTEYGIGYTINDGYANITKGERRR